MAPNVQSHFERISMQTAVPSSTASASPARRGATAVAAKTPGKGYFRTQVCISCCLCEPFGRPSRLGTHVFRTPVINPHTGDGL